MIDIDYPLQRAVPDTSLGVVISIQYRQFFAGERPVTNRSSWPNMPMSESWLCEAPVLTVYDSLAWY